MVTEAPTDVSPIDPSAASAIADPTGSFRGAAIAGGLALVAYAYVASRWGQADAVIGLMLIFALLLVGYAVLALFAVRRAVIAPFVVAALLLPWACSGAAALGGVQRVGSAIDKITNDFSGGLPDGFSEDSPVADATPTGDALAESDPGPGAAAAAAKYSEVIKPFNAALAGMSTAEEAYFSSGSNSDKKALQQADSRVAVSASQAATEIEDFDAWPDSVGGDAATLVTSMRGMAKAAQLMSNAGTSEERDTHYGEFFDAQTNGAPSAAAIRDGLGLPEAE